MTNIEYSELFTACLSMWVRFFLSNKVVDLCWYIFVLYYIIYDVSRIQDSTMRSSLFEEIEIRNTCREVYDGFRNVFTIIPVFGI